MTVGKVKTMNVCAAVFRRGGEVLICSRPEGSYMAGFWEFPGGKREPHEGDAACLRREIREELGVEIAVADRIYRFQNLTSERPIVICFYRTFLLSDPAMLHPKEGQRMRWVMLAGLQVDELVPADRPLGEFLRLQIS